MFRSKQYAFDLGGAFALYAALLIGAAAAERAIEPSGVVRLAINLVPMIGALTAAWAIMRGLWRMDELQRRIQFDAIAMSFLGTALLTFGWGFAEGAGVPRLQAFMVWPIMGTLWCAGLLIARHRYR